MPPERPPRLASWGSRVGAALLDGAIVWLIAILAIAVAAIPSTIIGTGGTPLWLLVSFLSAWAYYAATMVREGERNGQTLGKQLCNIRVVKEDGTPVTAGFAVLRDFVVKGLLFGFIGGSFFFPWLLNYLWPLWDDKNQALHDKMLASYVVKA